MNIVIATEEYTADIERMCRNFKGVSPYSSLEIDQGRLDHVVQSFVNGDKTQQIAFLALTDEGVPIGIVAGIITQFLFSDAKIAGEMIWWVDVEHRNTRAGIELHNAFEMWAKMAGCKIITMALLEDNNFEKVDGLYRKFGYRPAERSYMKEI